LAAHGKSLPVPDSPITPNFREASEIVCDLPTQISLYLVVLLDDGGDFRNLSLCKVFGPGLRIHPRGREDLSRVVSADAVNIAK